MWTGCLSAPATTKVIFQHRANAKTKKKNVGVKVATFFIYKLCERGRVISASEILLNDRFFIGNGATVAFPSIGFLEMHFRRSKIFILRLGPLLGIHEVIQK